MFKALARSPYSNAALVAYFISVLSSIGCGQTNEPLSETEIAEWMIPFKEAGDIKVFSDKEGNVSFETTSTEAAKKLFKYIEQYGEIKHYSNNYTEKVYSKAESETNTLVKYLDDPYLKCRAEISLDIGTIFGKKTYFTKGITQYERGPNDYQNYWAAVKVPPTAPNFVDSDHLDPRVVSTTIPTAEDMSSNSIGIFYSTVHTCCQSRIERDCNWIGSCWNAEHTRCFEPITLDP